MRFCCLALAFLLGAQGVLASDGLEDDYRSARWQEGAWVLPEYPSAGRLLPFYVSATTVNRFFIDAQSLSVGSDGVVRYALIIQGEQGARTVTFEGMRCETREKRIYAIGRSDSTWALARKSDWSKVVEISGNRHHAALFQEYFCPNGVIVRNVAEILGAFRQGGFTDITR